MAAEPEDAKATTPCPPYYAEPTHEQTLLFYTASYVRNSATEEFYQCIEGAYCNAPSFLGYNPPGEGYLWTEAWDKLDEAYPCNPELKTSTNFEFVDDQDQENDGDVGNSTIWEGAFGDPESETPQPTDRPTRAADLPSFISGAVWYDSNGDGRKNTLKNSVNLADKTAAATERGAGLSNMRVTLRECGTNVLVGVTSTFPQTFGGGGGDVEVVESSYLSAIQSQQSDKFGFMAGNGGLGIGNTEQELGYYSFRVLPFQLPGKFYVVFESSPGFRLSGGSGDYWEVYRAAMYDMVQPAKDAPCLQSKGGSDSESDESQRSSSPPTANPTEPPQGPINHSGYYARSKCISIQSSPTQITDVDVGLTKDTWPLVPYQFASQIVTIHFYYVDTTVGPTRNRERRRLKDSLECRKYQKLKSDGIEVEDIWGCENGGVGGPGAVEIADIEELTLEDADAVASALKDFLDNRISRVWTVKMVGLVHQKVTMLSDDGSDRRNLGSTSFQRHRATTKSRGVRRSLQANREIGTLELGFRIRAEYSSNKGDLDLAEVVGDSLLYGGDFFLSRLKSTMPMYFKPAGSVTFRDTLWKPEEIFKEESADSKDVDFDMVEQEPQLKNEDGNDGMSTGVLIGIIAGSVVFVVIAVCLVCRRRTRARRKNKGAVEDGGGNSQHSPQKKASSSGGTKKSWWKRKTAEMEGTKSKTKGDARKEARKKEPIRNLGVSSDIDGSSSVSDDEDYDDYSDDDLSSRFYSDCSHFDPEARAGDVGGYGDGGSVYSDELGSQSYHSQGTGTGDDSYQSYGTESNGSSHSSSSASRDYLPESVKSSATSGYSSKRNHRRGSIRSSATSGHSSKRSHRSARSSATRGSKTSTNRSSIRSNDSTNGETESNGGSYSSGSVSRDYLPESVRSSATSGYSSKKSHRRGSIRSSATSGHSSKRSHRSTRSNATRGSKMSTNQSSARSDGSMNDSYIG